MPQRVMAKCTRCNKNTDFWVIEELPPEDWSAEDSPFAVEKGYGSKAKK